MQYSRVGKIVTTFVAITLLVPSSAFAAAQVFFSPAIERIEAGTGVQTSVVVYADQKINAVSGAVQFSSSEEISVTISSGGSEIDYWVVEPVYDPSTNIARFEGVILGDGFGPGNATILTFTVQSESPTTITTQFIEGSILAADGNGTNVLTSFGGGSFSFTEPVTVDPAPSEPEPTPVDPAPEPSPNPEEPPPQTTPNPTPSTLPDSVETPNEGIEPEESGEQTPVDTDDTLECTPSDTDPTKPSDCQAETIAIPIQAPWPWSIVIPWLLVLAFALMTVVLALTLARTSKK